MLRGSCASDSSISLADRRSSEQGCKLASGLFGSCRGRWRVIGEGKCESLFNGLLPIPALKVLQDEFDPSAVPLDVCDERCFISKVVSTHVDEGNLVRNTFDNRPISGFGHDEIDRG